MFCRFCYAFIDSRINEEHAEEKDYCHIGKGCQSEEIIADDIDNHWYREQENPDRAIFQKVIPSRGLAFSQFAVYFSEFERRKANGIIAIVSSSIIVATTKHNLLLSANAPGSKISVSYNKTIINATAIEHIKSMRKFLTVFSILIIYLSSGVRFSIERPRVTSSAYSNSSPIAIPRAITVILTSYSASRRDM